jgi:CubicO group peptidase (beta-lactamase class C family)
MAVPAFVTAALPGIHVRVFPPEEITSISPAELPARAGGLSPQAIDRIWKSVVSLYRSGLHPAISVCLRRKGQVVLDRAIGHVRGNAPDDARDAPKVKATHASLFNLYSASKAITAMMVHLLDERGVLHIDDAVVEYIPEFGKHGKEGITLRQLLTHKAGIPNIPGVKIDLDLLTDRARMLDILCEARPLSVPGRRIAYHALTAGFVIGEIVQRVTGKDIRALLHESVTEPLGLFDFDYGVPRERVAEVAENVFTGMPAVPPHSWLLQRVLGASVEDATAFSNDVRFLTGIVPSGNIVATANDAGRFFEMLLRHGQLDGTRVFEGRTVRRAIAEQSYLEMDSFLGIPVRYGMGFMLGGDSFTVYGPSTAHTFGHLGFTNVIVYADPERDISVAILTSGKPFITPGQLHWLRIMRTIAELTR